MKRAKVKDGKIVQSENSVHYQVAQYLKIQYPTVLFHTDRVIIKTDAERIWASKLTKGFDWPDLFIAHPVGSRHGLFIEVKKERQELFLADGKTWKNSHILGQYKILQHLRALNYGAYFGCGFDECKELIDNYLSGQS